MAYSKSKAMWHIYGSHYPYFTLAYQAALESKGVGRSQFKHGAALVLRANTVVSGYNQYKTHPALQKLTEWPFLHAESHCIVKHGLNNCRGLDLYTIRIRKNGEIGLSCPCDTCKALIKIAGINAVYYSTDIGFEKWTPTQ